MKPENILDHLRSAIRRTRQNARDRRRSRKADRDFSQLSNHTLKDIGYRRDGAWIGMDSDF